MTCLWPSLALECAHSVPYGFALWHKERHDRDEEEGDGGETHQNRGWGGLFVHG